MINLACPKCQSAFQLGDEFLGMTVQCGSCNSEFIISTDGAAIPVESPNVEIVCPGCRTTHLIPGDARGAEAECMVCKVSFIVPETGNQGVAVGPAPAAAPSPAPAFAAPPPPPSAPFPAPAAAHKPEPTASGITPAAPGGIDYKNTSTIRLTRSSLFSGKPGAKSTPFGSGLIPPIPPTGALATDTAAPSRPAPAFPPPATRPAMPPPPAAPPPPLPPAPAPAKPMAAAPRPPAPAPAPAVPPPPPPAAKPSTSTTGKIPAAKAAAKAGAKGAGKPASTSPILAAKAAKAGVRPETGETVLEVKEISGEVEMPWLNLILALLPVILLPLFVILAADDKLGIMRSAGIGTVVSLGCWLGIIYRQLSGRQAKATLVVTDRRTVMSALGATTEVRNAEE